jgi:DNA-binding transcriptional ArsR family regulator
MDRFEALGDPTRRQIVELLATGERTAGEVAGAFAISRPAVSRHLRVLREAGLASSRSDAQRRVYRLEPEPMAEMEAWLARYRSAWTERLDRLERHIRSRTQTGGSR